ncbi:hypothetical protein [Xanthomonas arboricola]|uniref:Uncharacterized protein n=1 Tax=Xanthomonas arboricola TaxID=56448 RepID=A0AB73H245_9XANT|nr:hypothetical protein [Xanthomonas arboricola]MBB5672469.1 hypothetical protein [Xanthomonas arboricola]
MSYSDYNSGVQAERFGNRLNEARMGNDLQRATNSASAWKAHAGKLERRLVAAETRLGAAADESTVLDVIKDVALSNLAEVQAALAAVSPGHPLANAAESQLKRRKEVDRRLVAHNLVVDRSDPRSHKIIRSRG